MSLSPQNKHSLETIDSALFAICLDRDPASSNHDKSHHTLFHANDAHNRWFDKAIQLIVANNGRAGINGEVGKLFVVVVSSSMSDEGIGLNVALLLAYTSGRSHSRRLL